MSGALRKSAGRTAMATRILPDLSTIPASRVKAALAPEDYKTRYPDYKRTRGNEANEFICAMEEVLAIVAGDFFWCLAALLPGNEPDDGRSGRPSDHPSYMLLLCLMLSGVHGISTVRAATTWLASAANWRTLLDSIEAYRPAHWRTPAHRSKKRASRAEPNPTIANTAVPREPRGDVVQLRAELPSPPRTHHVAYFLHQLNGEKKQDGLWVPCEPGDPWFGVGKKVKKTFRLLALKQAQQMGLLDPRQPMVHDRADRHQWIGFDGTVLPMHKCKATTRPRSGFTTHETGEGKKVFGSKYSIASIRINGQYNSRVILDFAQCGASPYSDYSDEGAAIFNVAPELHELAQGGMKGLIADSIIRGQNVIDLQRQGITVVNYPHAESNPAAKTKRGSEKVNPRNNPQRKEKSHLRTVATHKTPNGNTCDHPLYFTGGTLVELCTTQDGTSIRLVEIKKYQQRQDTSTKSGSTKKGRRREYFVVEVHCEKMKNPDGTDYTFTATVPLFHTDAVSTDPSANWGEFVRVYSPTSCHFQYLYGARNDTESRHAGLKPRLRHLSRDIRTQNWRMLAAATAMNAAALQIHFEAHGLANVLSGTG